VASSTAGSSFGIGGTFGSGSGAGEMGLGDAAGVEVVEVA